LNQGLDPISFCDIAATLKIDTAGQKITALLVGLLAKRPNLRLHIFEQKVALSLINGSGG
jgi:hypothetical protein